MIHLPPSSSLPPRHYDSSEEISGGILSGGIHGHVVVHPSVTIAPTALLQAESGSQLILAAGVCVGSGVILHAHGGTLEIEAGVSLGSAVLLIGSGKIGANACVGSMVTIMNPAIAPGTVVTAGTLLGDASRSVSPPQAEVAAVNPVEPAFPHSLEPNPWEPNPLATNPWELSPPEASPQPSTSTQNGAGANGTVEAHPAEAQPPDAPEPRKTQLVTGKAALNELITALFPHRQHFEQP